MRLTNRVAKAEASHLRLKYVKTLALLARISCVAKAEASHLRLKSLLERCVCLLIDRRKGGSISSEIEISSISPV